MLTIVDIIRWMSFQRDWTFHKGKLNSNSWSFRKKRRASHVFRFQSFNCKTKQHWIPTERRSDCCLKKFFLACVCCKYTSDVYIPFYFAFSCVLFVFAYSQLCSSHCYSINSKSYSAFSRSFRFVLIVKLPHSDTHLNNVRRKSKKLKKKILVFVKVLYFLIGQMLQGVRHQLILRMKVLLMDWNPIN